MGLKNSRNLLEERIETERLFLLPISMKYKEDIFREFTSDITTFMYPAPAKHISETEDFINDSLKGLKENNCLQLVIVDKKSYEFLGCVGLHKIDTKNPEMGIWLKLQAHGLGYGREAVFAIKDWVDQNLDYDYLVYPAADKNIASRKIPEFLGAKVGREYDEVNMEGNKHHYLEYRIYSKN